MADLDSIVRGERGGGGVGGWGGDGRVNKGLRARVKMFEIDKR